MDICCLGCYTNSRDEPSVSAATPLCITDERKMCALLCSMIEKAMNEKEFNYLKSDG